MTRLSRATTTLFLLACTSTAIAAGTVKGTVTTGGGPLGSAVVVLDGPTVRTEAPPRVVIDQRDQTFVPHVVAVPVGSTIDFPNHDTMLHNVYSASPAKRFDLDMYRPGESRSVTFDTPGIVRIGCNVHPKMEAFVVIHPNPWVAVTDAQGSYTIGSVPAGTYELRVWHESGAETRLPVTVHDDAVAPVDVKLNSNH